MLDWTKLADDSVLEKTAAALRSRGIDVVIVRNRDEAKRKVLELIPGGSEVMEGSSVTLDEIGVTDEIEGGRYVSLRDGLKATMGSAAPQREEARRRATSPAYGIGSVHAVTEDGRIVIASASGSQLAFYVYGAKTLIWVVGTQKIVKNLDMAFERIYQYTLPLVVEEPKYGVPGTSVNKILIFDRETVPNRVKLIFVKEKLGF